MKIHLYTSAFVAASTLFLAGCTKESIIDNHSGGNNGAVLTLKTKVFVDYGQSREQVVKTLRLVVFNSSGNTVANELYDDAAELATLNEYSIRKRLKSNLGVIRICLIANEPSTWSAQLNEPSLTYGWLSALMIQYNDEDYQFISNNSRVENMNLYTADDDLFLMYGERSINFADEDVNAGTLGLDRTCAKVSLTLKYSNAINGLGNGERLEIKSAAIMYQPLGSMLINTEAKRYESEDYLPTHYIPFDSVASSDQFYTQLQPAVFYIPEYYLSQKAYDAGLHTYIEVLGEIYVGTNKRQTVVYKIPLGEGVQKLYDTEPDNNALVVGDYAIVRNHHYIVNGTIDNLGEKDGIQLQLAVRDWEDGNKIEIEEKAPYLNVSEIALERRFIPNPTPDGTTPPKTILTDKIFFWSNEDDISVESLQCIANMQDGTKYNFAGTDTMFKALTGNAYRATLVRYTPDAAGHSPKNGYVEIYFEGEGWSMLQNPFADIVMTFYVKAGSLKRKVTITYIKQTS